jgi:hypothetical protein
MLNMQRPQREKKDRKDRIHLADRKAEQRKWRRKGERGSIYRVDCQRVGDIAAVRSGGNP